MKETKTRSILKSAIWRVVGVLILGSITYFYTGSWVTTSLVTFIHHGVFLFIFYFHERAWLRLKHPANSTLRKLAKMFAYETCAGNLILGTITYLITGSWKTSSAITITYIGTKHLTYIFNEFIWDQIKTGRRV